MSRKLAHGQFEHSPRRKVNRSQLLVVVNEYYSLALHSVLSTFHERRISNKSWGSRLGIAANTSCVHWISPTASSFYELSIMHPAAVRATLCATVTLGVGVAVVRDFGCDLVCVCVCV
jgi:hypothetical protein